MHYDLLILGSGSANTIPGPEFAGQRIALVEEGVFGGTCLNVGCIPTKMFVHTANVARQAADAGRLGVDLRLDGVDWPAIRERIFGRIDPISAAGKDYRENNPDNANLTLYTGHATFVAPKTVQITLAEGSESPAGAEGQPGARTVTVSADRVVVATGSRPAMPDVAGLDGVGALDNASIMRLEELPASLLVLGSGYIAAEMADVFSALGVDVTAVARGQRMLRQLDFDISRAYTNSVGYRLVTGFQATSAAREDGMVRLTGTRGGEEITLEAEQILVATGRIPNADTLNPAAAGIAVEGGRICADSYQRALGHDGRPLDGVFTLGDVSSPYMLKHVANHEARVVRHNLLHPDAMIESVHDAVPAAVFSHPQIATVGMTEEEARKSGKDYVVGVQKYADIAYGWAMEDTTNFCKIIAERGSTRILGCHIIGPQAPTLIQVIVQAMATGQSAADIARTQYWIHPAMPELVENALLQVV
ncbi:mycothione reductase [Trueperella bernardiae]|uniref:mycothione reductase n=1 Tax=Trueperella bernardiae TaxID=59561 RepID=UPI0025539889|nr:mycothione reductase [Trueperella bernardiae]MDV6239340.1 mycothione reductase [Trueperella bernardiae]WIM07655.1 mycothione reductase [Trueperella bernardiae]